MLLTPLPAQPRQEQGCLRGIAQAEMALPVRTHLHSLHFNALVQTSVAISARFSTGPARSEWLKSPTALAVGLSLSRR
jgi:hypothetical protein